MKIVFYSDNTNLNTGSYRIWVHDLNKTLLENGNSSKIVHFDLKNIPSDTDVVIFCKSAYKKASEFKKLNTKAMIGAINVSCDHWDPNLDFVIVGSPEEYASLGRYKNVFIYPLIERKFEKINRKIHTNDNEVLKLCFHGHYPHLFKFEPFLKTAIEKFDSEVRKVQLNIITGHPNFNWQTGRPNVDIKIHNYDKSFTEIMQSCDIGLVPNVSDIRLSVPDIQKVTSVDLGLYSTDYFLRMKNKTNAGRAYVFYQHGLPVIHDLSPSSFELMSITGYNICAHDDAGWFRELNRLSSFKVREKVSQSYYDAFKQYYNPHNHTKKLFKEIGEIFNGKN